MSNGAKRGLLLTCAAIFWFSLYIYIPYLTPELMSIGVGASLAGVICALHSLTQMIVRAPVGLRSGRTGRHKGFVMAGMGLSALAAFLMYFWPTVWMFAIGNAISGFSSAMYVAITVLYGRYYSNPAHSEKAMGLVTTLGNAGILAAFLIGGTAWQEGGMRQIMLIAGVSALIGLVVSLFVVEDPSPPTHSELADMKTVLHQKQLIISSILCVLVKLVVFGTAYSFTPKVAQDLGAKGFELSLVNGLFIGASVLGSFFVTTAAGRKMGDYAMSLAGFAALAAYAISIPFIRVVGVLMTMQFVGGLGYSSLTSIFMANAVRELPLKHKSAGMGVYQAMYSLGSTLGPIVVGFMSEYVDKGAGFITVGGIAIGGIVLTMYARRAGVLGQAKGPCLTGSGRVS